MPPLAGSAQEAAFLAHENYVSTRQWWPPIKWKDVAPIGYLIVTYQQEDSRPDKQPPETGQPQRWTPGAM